MEQDLFGEVKAVSEREKSRVGTAFPAGRYFLFDAVTRRDRKNSKSDIYKRIQGRAFATSLSSAYGIIKTELTCDGDDVRIRLSEVPPIAMFVTLIRPGDELDWEDLKEYGPGSVPNTMPSAPPRSLHSGDEVTERLFEAYIDPKNEKVEEGNSSV